MPIATPDAAIDRFADAWNAGDARALAALFDEDADFVNVVGIWWRRRRAIEKAHGYALTRFFRDSRLTVEEVAVKRLGADVATVHGRWRLEGQRAPDDGRPLDPRRGVLLLVLHRGGDGWSVAAAQNTDIVPGAETLAAAAGALGGADYGGGRDAHR